MAKNRGYTLSGKDYDSVRRLVRESRRTPVPYTRYQRKSVPFQPAAGSKVYQCVAGTRLKYGTVANPDNSSYTEPVVLAVYLGTAGEDDLPEATNYQMFALSQVLPALGIITARNLVDTSALDYYGNSPSITDITNGEGLTMLRVRGCPGYVGTGDIVIGNDTEAWWSSGEQVRQCVLKAKWVDGTDKVYAKIEMNRGAIDAEIATEGTLIYDKVAIRTPNDEAVCMSEDDVVLAEFGQQVFFYDDSAYEDYFWYDHSDLGWLPCLTLVNAPVQQAITHTASETQIPPYGCVRLDTAGVDTTGVMTVARPNTYGSQYSHFFNGPNAVDVGESGWAQTGDSRLIAAYDSADGTPAAGELWGPRSGTYLLKKNTGGFIVRGVISVTKSLVLVDRCPFVRFHGTADAAITKTNTGTISIYYGDGAGTDSTVNMNSVYNSFADVAINKHVECVWEGDLAGIKWKMVAAEC